MSDRIGKYYWIKTEGGKEIGFKRDSGAWEMHGIDCTKDLRSEVLEVYEEVANEDIKQPEKALAIQGVVQAKPEKVCELIRQKFDDWVFGLETQAGEKLKVVDSTDFNEIITEIESELKDL